MKIPFTTDQFLDIFAQYNVAVWPAQVVLLLLAVVCIFLAVLGGRLPSKIVSVALSLFWLWMGGIYHFIFLSRITKAAWLFGALFVLQAGIFIDAGVRKSRLSFRLNPDRYGVIGIIAVTYALGIYPIAGYLIGHRYPAAVTFGLPCPTTLFVFGFFLWIRDKVPLYVLVIPLAWSLISLSAALSLSMKEDFGLVAAPVIFGLLTYRNCRRLKLPAFPQEANLKSERLLQSERRAVRLDERFEGHVCAEVVLQPITTDMDRSHLHRKLQNP